MKSEPRGVLPLLTIFGVVLADQLTKWWISQTFALHEARQVVPGFFNLVYVTNTGAAFSFMAGEQSGLRQVFFVTVSLVALVALHFAYRHYRSQGWLYGCSLGLIAGGAAGNLIDRLRFGAVTDFLDFYVHGYHWPAFNVADVAITVGVGLFLLASLRSGAR